MTAMELCDYILVAVREFEECSAAKIQKHLEIEQVWDQKWTRQEKTCFARSTRWRKATGVYFFVDCCTNDDIHGVPRNGKDRYSVIRRLGSATYSFGDRLTDYDHRERREPGEQVARHWVKKQGRWDGLPWFRYTRIYIIRTDEAWAVLLERFLLERIRTELNDKDVPRSLKMQPPRIYDSQV